MVRWYNKVDESRIKSFNVIAGLFINTLEMLEKLQPGKIYDAFSLYAGRHSGQELCEQIVDVSPLALRLIPEEYKNPELCRRVLHNCTSAHKAGIVGLISDKKVFQEAFDMGVFTGKNSPIGAAKLMKIRYPYISLDEKIAEKAIALDGQAGYLQTEKMLDDAVMAVEPLILLSPKIKEKIKIPAVYKMASHLDSKNFNFIPETKPEEKFKDWFWRDFYYVQQIKNVDKSDAVLYFFPLKPEECTGYVSSVAVDISHVCFKNVSAKFQTEKMILTALQGDGDNIEYIELSKITDEMYLKAFENSPYLLRNLSPKLIRFDMCMDAVAFDCNLLKDMPGALMSREFCDHTLQHEKDPIVLKESQIINYIPYSDIRLQMIKDNPMETFDMIKGFLPEYIDKDIANKAIQQGIQLERSVIPPMTGPRPCFLCSQTCKTASNNRLKYRMAGYKCVPLQRCPMGTSRDDW